MKVRDIMYLFKNERFMIWQRNMEISTPILSWTSAWKFLRDNNLLDKELEHNACFVSRDEEIIDMVCGGVVDINVINIKL